MARISSTIRLTAVFEIKKSVEDCSATISRRDAIFLGRPVFLMIPGLNCRGTGTIFWLGGYFRRQCFVRVINKCNVHNEVLVFFISADLYQKHAIQYCRKSTNKTDNDVWPEIARLRLQYTTTRLVMKHSCYMRTPQLDSTPKGSFQDGDFSSTQQNPRTFDNDLTECVTAYNCRSIRSTMVKRRDKG